MLSMIKKLALCGLLALPFLLLTPQDADAQRRHRRHDGYWSNYWRWYDRDYRPYWHNRNRYYYRDHDGDFGYSVTPRRYYYYRNPYSGYYYYGHHGRHSLRGRHNSIDIGPLHLDWR